MQLQGRIHEGRVQLQGRIHKGWVQLQGRIHEGRGPQMWVAKFLNVGLHNYFDLMLQFFSVIFLNFLVLKLFDLRYVGNIKFLSRKF